MNQAADSQTHPQILLTIKMWQIKTMSMLLWGTKLSFSRVYCRYYACFLFPSNVNNFAERAKIVKTERRFTNVAGSKIRWFYVKNVCKSLWDAFCFRSNNEKWTSTRRICLAVASMIWQLENNNKNNSLHRRHFLAIGGLKKAIKYDSFHFQSSTSNEFMLFDLFSYFSVHERFIWHFQRHP